MTISMRFNKQFCLILSLDGFVMHALNGKVNLELRRAVWGLLQAGILASKRLRQKLAPFGYKEHTNTPGLWYHETCLISFTLVVDDF